MPEENATMTFDDILSDKNYQSEFDKRVTKALDTAKSKWDTDAARREAELLSSLGIESKDDIPKLQERLKSTKEQPKQEESVPMVTPEQFNQLSKQLETVQGELAKSRAEKAEKAQLDFLANKEVPKEQLRYYRFEISQLVKDGVSFEDAAAQFIQDNPPIKRPPEFHVGGGNAAAATTMTLDDYKKMPYAEKLKLKDEKPTVYEHFKKLMGF